MTSIESRIRRQRKIVDAMRRQLIFEALVLERLKGRAVRIEPAIDGPKTISDLLERALQRSLALTSGASGQSEEPWNQGD